MNGENGVRFANPGTRACTSTKNFLLTSFPFNDDDDDNNNNNNNNSVALVRERTALTERTPLVGEVSANFCG
jgi:hypothetical protein